MNIQWFPGHMTKARRMMEQNMRLVDAVCEIVDARIPRASQNPEMDLIAGEKPRLIILNRIDLADPQVTALWREHFRSAGLPVLETDSKSGRGVAGLSKMVKALLKDKIRENAARGQAGRPIRAMVVGIPNVGKSTFINKAARRKAAKASDKPGVTRGKQWITVDTGFELLDTPGILWPKIGSRQTGQLLAYTGAIRDEVIDRETLAAGLMACLKELYPQCLTARYKIQADQFETGFDLLEAAAKKRGFLISGGEYDIERMSVILLDEFRGGQLGRISLERPGEEGNDSGSLDD